MEKKILDVCKKAMKENKDVLFEILLYYIFPTPYPSDRKKSPMWLIVKELAKKMQKNK